MDRFNRLHLRNDIWAYRYKGDYFRFYLKGDAHVDEAGTALANMIPRDAVERETWIQHTIQSIENEVVWRREGGLTNSRILRPVGWGLPKKDPYEDYDYEEERDSDEEGDEESDEEEETESEEEVLVYGVEPGHLVWERDRIAFMDIVPGTNMEWLMPDFEKSIWTYVLDLDDRAFTVNGRIHFPMDNMPPGKAGWIQYLWTGTKYDEMYCAHRPDTPGEYMMSVNRWTEPFLRPAQDHVNAYRAVIPQETPLAEWGVPQWDSLTLPQALSAKLLRIVLVDHAGRLHNPDLLGERRLFNCVQWQILCAAAPSLVIYPPPFEEPPSWVRVPNPNIYLTLRWKDDKGVISPVTPHYQQDRKDRDGWDEKASWWLRGCLVTFCRRLDQPDFVQAAIFRMTKALRHSGQKNAIGLLFSGQHVAGVALDSPRIRHTPTLLVYDRDMRPHDGALLIMHLLSPGLTINKTPWATLPPRRPAIHVLPNELIATIMELIDYDTYMLMPFVSHAFRSLYLDQPRINETILMRAIPGGFAVKDRLTGEAYEACLVRKRMIANYRTLNKCFQQRQLGLGLGFYTKMVENPWGSYSEETHATFKKNGREYESEYRLDHHVVEQLEGRSGMPEVRSQAVEGEWELERGLDLEEYGSWKDVLDPKLGWRGTFRYE